MLTQSRRPLLLAGGGIIDSEATQEAVELAQLLDMALVPSYRHNNAVPNSHRLYGGPPRAKGQEKLAKPSLVADFVRLARVLEFRG